MVIDLTTTSKVDNASALVTGTGGESVVNDGAISTPMLVVEVSTVLPVVISELVAAFVVTSVGGLVVFV